MTDSELRQLGREMSSVMAGQEALRRDLVGVESRLGELMAARLALLAELDKRLRSIEMSKVQRSLPDGEAGILKDLRDWIILAVLAGSAIGGIGNPIEFIKALVK